LPTSPSLPYILGMKETDPNRLYLGDIFTVPISLGGLPGISLSMGLNEEGLPLSVQLVGQRYFDAELLGIASVLERIVGRPAVAAPGGREAA
ncbi:MAG: Asp-tRNA(Asn)/Glu-tRNA(Gln) amidotransferase subunit GatA, partial [Synergistaceae bacterium]|nr:Asp-tRNA(Asn)/Glu-tRNA(Gln) amidotransferase subunit GatA [Synergistaceae bacterium]